MHEVQKLDLRRASEWLTGEVEVRISKKWLVFGMVAIAVLVAFALD